MLDKPLKDIKLADLQELIVERVQEGKDIEYKKEMYLLDHPDPKSQNHQKEELLKDVSSFANTIGGHLIIGMAEDNKIPTDIPGLDIAERERQEGRLHQIIARGLYPRISYDIFPVDVDAAKYALVIRVAQSFDSPHRVVYPNPFGQFYYRTSTGAQQMDTSELRRAFALTQSTYDRIKQFRHERVGAVVAGDTPVPIDGTSALVLHLIPLSAFAARSAYSTGALANKSATVWAPGADGSRIARINFDGVAISSKLRPCYAQVFRNGVIEGVRTGITHQIRDRPGIRLSIGTIQKAILEWIPGCLQCYRELGVHPPVFCFVTLTQVRDAAIYIEEVYDPQPPIDRDLLNLPEVVFDDLAASPRALLIDLFDMIWNAAGHEKSWEVGVTVSGRRPWV